MTPKAIAPPSTPNSTRIKGEIAAAADEIGFDNVVGTTHHEQAPQGQEDGPAGGTLLVEPEACGEPEQGRSARQYREEEGKKAEQERSRHTGHQKPNSC